MGLIRDVFFDPWWIFFILKGELTHTTGMREKARAAHEHPTPLEEENERKRRVGCEIECWLGWYAMEAISCEITRLQ